MNELLAKVIDEHVPKFTPEVVNGLATEYMPLAPEFIDGVIKSAMKSTTPLLKYEGWRMATPEEMVATLFGAKNTTSKVDMSRSDVYLILLFFSYNGEKLPPNKLLVPYVGEGGTMYISGNKYHTVPVLTDTVISPTNHMTFVRLLRDKLTFNRGMHNIMVDGVRTPAQVIYSNIYRNKKDTTKWSGITTPSSIYLVARYGFKGAFERYVGSSAEIVYDRDLVKKDGWIVYGSTKFKPPRNASKTYHGHDAKILIPDNEYTKEQREFIDNCVSGIIYTFDMYPERAKELTDAVNAGNLKKETQYWTIVLGTLIHNNAYSIDRMYGNAVDHMRTVENYMDSYSKDKLENIGIHIDNFFDFIAELFIRYADLLLGSKAYSNNIMNRYIDILYYVVYDIIVGIHTALLEITRKTDKRVLKTQEVAHTMMTKISYRKIFNITSHLSSLFVDYTGDNKYPKITSILELQERGDGVRKGKNDTIPEPAKTLSAYDAYMGSIMFVPKKVPSPKMRINPFVKLDVATGRFGLTAEMEESMRRFESMISGSNKEDNLMDNELEFDIDLEENRDLLTND